MRMIFLIIIGLSLSANAQRFERDANTEIVTDRQTKLMWQDDANAKNTEKDWVEAIAYCEGLRLGDYDDWRLPNIRELITIVDKGRYNPAIYDIFVNIDNNGYNYWSSTTAAGQTNHAWRVDFADGRRNMWGAKTETAYVRCVRDQS